MSFNALNDHVVLGSCLRGCGQHQASIESLPNPVPLLASSVDEITRFCILMCHLRKQLHAMELSCTKPLEGGGGGLIIYQHSAHGVLHWIVCVVWNILARTQPVLICRCRLEAVPINPAVPFCVWATLGMLQQNNYVLINKITLRSFRYSVT